MKERLWMLFTWSLARHLILFSTAFCRNWLLTAWMDALLSGWRIGWMVRPKGSLWMELNLTGSCSQVLFSRTHYWGQPCLIFLSVTLIRGLSTLSVSLQVIPSWVGVLICVGAGSLCKRDLGRLDWWTAFNCIALNKGKWWVEHLARNNPMQWYRPGEEWLESCPAEKDMGVLVNSQLKMSHQCAHVAKKANGVLACNRSGVSNRIGEGTVSLYLSMVRSHFMYRLQFRAPHYKKDIELFEYLQRRAKKLLMRLENQDIWGAAEGTVTVQFREKEAQKTSLLSTSPWQEAALSSVLIIPSQVTIDRTQGNGLKSQ